MRCLIGMGGWGIVYFDDPPRGPERNDGGVIKQLKMKNFPEYTCIPPSCDTAHIGLQCRPVGLCLWFNRFRK